jgi:CheY-like chemotaxis protein
VEAAIAGAAADGRPFALAFLDITMRRVNGDVVARALRAAGCRLPLVAVTGERRHAHLVAAGFDEVR